jgi:hypothetical protein
MSQQQTIPHDITADLDALTEALDAGEAPDSELVQRVQERAEQARKKLHQREGLLNIAVTSVREDRDAR